MMLEPGCGSGKFGLWYSLNSANVDLFDIDPDVVEYSTRLWKALEALLKRQLPVRLGQGDLFQIDSLFGFHVRDQYDLVFNEGVAQHWPDEERRQGCIDLMARCAKPGGLVVIVGNNGHNPREQETDRTFKFTYEGMPPTRKCFTREELKERMERAGLRDVQVVPLGLPSWSQATLLGGYGRKP